MEKIIKIIITFEFNLSTQSVTTRNKSPVLIFPTHQTRRGSYRLRLVRIVFCRQYSLSIIKRRVLHYFRK